MKFRSRILVLWTAPALCMVLSACATTPDSVPADRDAVAAPPAVHATGPVRVNFSGEGRLGALVRAINESSGGGLVLMAGLEYIEIDQVRFAHAPLLDVAQTLAGKAGLAVQQTPNYFLLYPPGYEALRDVSLLGRSHARFDSLLAEMRFGANTELFTIFSWIGQATGVTIVADNAIADAVCGEVAVGEIPLREGLEAVLKSARLAAVGVRSSEDYIFLYTPGRELPDSTQIDGDRVDAQKQRYLLNRVDLYLPTPPSAPGKLDLHPGAQPLRDTLASLSRQLGAPVVAERGLEGLPVNPVTLQNVSVATALDLLIWQWPVDEYGYQVTGDRIVIRRR